MTLRERVALVVWRNETARSRRLEAVVAVVIVASLVAFTLETMPSLPPVVRRAMAAVELAAILFFTLEYALRLWSAPNPLRYAASFWGLVDLLSFLPYWVTAASGFQTARVLRLLMLVRLLKLVRYAHAARRMKRAFLSVREELILFLIAAAVANYFAAVGIYAFEHDAQPDKFSSVPASLWWSLVTLTTVGYGDVYPVTTGGRIFTAVVLLTGLGIIAVPTGLISAALQTVRKNEGEPVETPKDDGAQR